MAEACANEKLATMVCVNPNDLIVPDPNESVRNLRSFIKAAEDNHPALMFIEEFDRLNMCHLPAEIESGKKVRKEFVNYIDSQVEELMLIGSTNFPWEARRLMFRKQFRNIFTEEYKHIGKLTEYSGSDINMLIREIQPIRELARTGENQTVITKQPQPVILKVYLY